MQPGSRHRGGFPLVLRLVLLCGCAVAAVRLLKVLVRCSAIRYMRCASRFHAAILGRASMLLTSCHASIHLCNSSYMNVNHVSCTAWLQDGRHVRQRELSMFAAPLRLHGGNVRTVE